MRNHQHRTARRLTALGFAVVAAAAPAATAAAPPDESGVVTRESFPDGRVYAEDGIVVLTGPAFEEGCFGVGFAEPVISFIRRPDGTEISHYSVVDQIQVFRARIPLL